MQCLARAQLWDACNSTAINRRCHYHLGSLAFYLLHITLINFFESAKDYMGWLQVASISSK